MTNTLADPVDLEIFPGHPFDEDLVDAAVADIRAEARWHIAPVVTETVRVEVSGFYGLLVLPSLKVVTVTAVRDVSGTTPRTVTGWKLRPGGLLYLTYVSFGDLFEVDLQHGYATTPLDLLPVVASRAQDLAAASQRRMMSMHRVAIDDYSEQATYRGDYGTVDPVLARYSLPPPSA